ncbi:MAG: DUF4442 domain-containing protein [Thermonemataceae bacterium]
MKKLGESWLSWWLRIRLNWLPAYRTTGGRITFISAELNELYAQLPMSWQTRNPVGTFFGSAIYGAFEPLYSFLLSRALGKNYIVWDRADKIIFKQPANNTLYGVAYLDAARVKQIKRAVDSTQEANFYFALPIVNRFGEEVATLQQTLYVSRKDYYKIVQAHRAFEKERKYGQFY